MLGRSCCWTLLAPARLGSVVVTMVRDRVGCLIGSAHHSHVRSPSLMTLTNDECRGLLSRYQEALASRGQSKTATDNKLLALDSWRLTCLSSIVRQRVTPYMTKEELEKLMDCK